MQRNSYQIHHQSLGLLQMSHWGVLLLNSFLLCSILLSRNWKYVNKEALVPAV